ncbi:glycosyltransferase family 39 protein [Neisseria animalis]|uniref:Glycosyltransferase family 39 protein n=1 Tax=Neisseria animalis TaxID=492 RepID=A0A5P3MTP9_NEIAN|nr:glycosyltransferase family 39 protein [Neisseria animalis]QEY24029.1 glycosyltransferase family 39 protein [Neisseria animalis]ROW32597.1 glycosyltransferase family 39 protein [Neisseria animalis]VEE06116.1 inner membrane protein [Neisseria animalis]
MLTYTPPESRPIAKTREQPWLLLLMAFAWLWPGVFSHGLWNPGEPAVFAAVEAMQSGASPLVADVLGETDFRISPVYLWTAAAFQNLLTPWAAGAYDAARFASVLFTVIGLTCCGFAGFNFLGRHHGRSVVLILIGCFGLLQMAHFMSDMTVGFAALGMVLNGFSLARRRVIVSSLLLGGGAALLSLTAGFALPLALLAMALVLPLHPQWRFKRYYITLFGALAVGLPLLVVYPFLLFKLQPDMFELWLNRHIFGEFGGIANVQTAFSLPYYLKNLLWFALPAWPLAVWTLTRIRTDSQPWSILAVSWIAVTLVLLAAMPRQFQDYLMWLLPPLALLGAAQLDGLRRGAAAFINWFGIMAFGLTAAFLWVGFFAMNYGWPAKLAERAAYFSPYYTPETDIVPMMVAILFTPLWLLAITRKNIKGRQAVTNWAAGVTLVWALLMTLFLPWLDAAKSYEPVVKQMQAALPSELSKQFADGRECLYVAENDRRARLAWGQYSDIALHTGHAECRYRLVQQPKDTATPQGWVKRWQGARPRNDKEGFALLERANAE